MSADARAASLDVQGARAGYGAIQVLHDVSFHVDAGEAVALLGANGAGKSTLLKAISGAVPLTAGSIDVDATDIAKLDARRVARHGVIHVPEGRRIFTGLTVKENLLLGCSIRQVADPVTIDEVCGIMPILADKLDRPAGNLSGGEQQALAIARGFLSNPTLLLLDEPSLGLSPKLVDELCDVILQLRSVRPFSLLIVEQDVNLAAQITSRAYVLRTGRLVAEYQSAEILGNPDFLSDYLSGKVGAGGIVAPPAG